MSTPLVLCASHDFKLSILYLVGLCFLEKVKTVVESISYKIEILGIPFDTKLKIKNQLTFLKVQGSVKHKAREVWGWG